MEQSAVELFISKPVLRELRKILSYPELRQKNSALTDTVIDEFLAHLLFRATLIQDVPHTVDFSRDPSDEPYLDLAALANAHYLVSRDKDLLSLATNHSLEAKQFRQRFPLLHIVTPGEFLAACADLSS